MNEKVNPETARHSFVVCAYKDSAHIDGLLDSLFAQTVKSPILIATSTPTDTLYEKAKRLGLEVRVNDKSEGIGPDWNFAYSVAETDFVTLAHQDDFFAPDYTEKILGALDGAKNPIIAYTDYFEMRTEGNVENNLLLRVKRLMNAHIGRFPRSKFIRRRILSLGSSVNCWSVTYNKKRFPDFRFDREMKVSLDWEAWERLSKEDGEFLYIPEMLTAHRVHAGSTTTACIENGDRHIEDLIMFKRFWPAPIARLILNFYEQSLKSNDDKSQG